MPDETSLKHEVFLPFFVLIYSFTLRITGGGIKIADNNVVKSAS